MKTLMHSATLIAPTWCIDDPVLQAPIRNMTEEAGGVTISEAKGAWYSPTGRKYTDDVTLLKWWHYTTPRLGDIIKGILDLGEKAVIVEFTNGSSEWAVMYTLEDFK